jgi:hypothetical protein
MSMSTDIFVLFFFSLVIRGIFYLLEQVHKQEWRFVVYLKKCLSNVRTHGPFWKWNAHTIIIKSFNLLFQRGLDFIHWFNLLPLPFLECWALIAPPLAISF